MMTIPQIGKLGYMPDRALRRLIAEGEVKTIKIGNRHYVNLNLLEKYLNGELGKESAENTNDSKIHRPN